MQWVFFNEDFSYTRLWKFKKFHKPDYNFSVLLEQKECFAKWGEYAVQAAESGRLTFKQLEACRRALRRGLGKNVKLRWNIFPNRPVSQKSLGARMGKEKDRLLIGSL